MRRGPTPGAVYELEGDEITIGRGNKSTIVIRDNEVSREHCRLVRRADDYELFDLSSSNGTFVNGQRVLSPWLLQSSMLIELGDTITLEYGVAAAETLPKTNNPPAEAPVAAPETSAHFSLTMAKGPAIGYVYPLEGKTVSIGRDLTNDIVVQDPEVSRFHLRLHFSDRGYLIEDLRSTNGTFINTEPIHERRCLEPNDVIKLGTMVQLQYIFREEGVALGSSEDETPRSRPVETDSDKSTKLADFFHVDPQRRAISARTTGLVPGALRDHLMVVYAREDWESTVAPLLVRMQDTRLNAWVDQYLVMDSDDWRMAVEQALGECWLMIVVISPEALNSSYVKMMYRYFLNQAKPVIPLVRDPAQTLPGELNRLRSILYNPQTNPSSFHKLIFEIMQLHQQT